MSNSLSTIDLFKAEELTGLWGLSDQVYFVNHPGHGIPNRQGLCIDGWAMTFAYNVSGEITEEPVFDYLPSTIAYDAITPRSALLLGSGGGIDVICARRRGVPSITAVEINAITMKLSTTKLAAYNGNIFRREGVEPVIAEGRSYVTAAGSRRWDLIQLSGVDTLAASQAGAFTLAESYLYTRESFETLLSHLNRGGVLTLTRWLFDPPRHNLRLIAVADAALRQLGVRDTASHFMLIADTRGRFVVSLISRSPFDYEQSRKVLDACQLKGFRPLAIPHFNIGPKNNPFQTLVNIKDKGEFISHYPFDISVTTDDRPFFFEHTKWRNAWSSGDYILNKFNGHLILLVTTLMVAVLGILFILVPARYGLLPQARAAGHYRRLAYFSCLGLGYVLIEMVLIQKLTLYLGNPVYSLAVVLCAMLVFSGIGSLFSGHVNRYGPKGIVVASLAVALTLVGYRVGMDVVLHATLEVPLEPRIAIALTLLALPSTLMGVPFPAAVATLEPPTVVRVWVVNGYFSILGSCLTMVLSISFGFSFVLLIGAAIYSLAAAAWWSPDPC